MYSCISLSVLKKSIVKHFLHLKFHLLHTHTSQLQSSLLSFTIISTINIQIISLNNLKCANLNEIYIVVAITKYLPTKVSVASRNLRVVPIISP